MKLNNKGYAITIIVFGILIVFIIVLSSLLVTMNNSVKLNKTVKQDVIENIQLGADTTGMSLTERIEQLETNYASIEQKVVDKIYPVGSIYLSMNEEDLSTKFGGEWELIETGRTLLSAGTSIDESGNTTYYKVGTTGGSSYVTINESNLPSHSHTYTPSGTIESTFTGTVSNTQNDGAHEHTGIRFSGLYGLGSSSSQAYGDDIKENQGVMIGSTGWNTDKLIVEYTGSNHSHAYTPSGTVSSTFTGTASDTGSAGSGTSFSVQNPYITVYMYKRIG